MIGRQTFNKYITFVHFEHSLNLGFSCSTTNHCTVLITVITLMIMMHSLLYKFDITILLLDNRLLYCIVYLLLENAALRIKLATVF